MHRLVGLRWKPGDYAGRHSVERMAERMAEAGGWTALPERRGFRLFICEDRRDVAPLVLSNGAGVVLGGFFAGNEGMQQRKTAVSHQELQVWCESDGGALTQNCWGHYLAVLVDGARDRVLVVRDPTGARPCFVATIDNGVRVVFTDLSDFAAIHPLPEIDHTFIAWFLAQPRLVSDRTGLQNVREVLAGECLCLGASGFDPHLAWGPPHRNAEMINAPATAIAEGLRATVNSAMRAWTALELPIVHRLSGGLDSSIALSALVQAEPGAGLKCVNEYTRGIAEGDEREAARASAARFGVELVEVGYEPKDLDYERLNDAPLSAKPSITQMSFADAHFLARAGIDRATLLTSGQGGDQVFYRSNALCTVADAVRDKLGVSRALDVALDAARVSRRSVWPALRMALEYGYARHPRGHVRAVLVAAAGAAGAERTREVVDEAMRDPWVREAVARGPGAGMRALHLADLQYYHAPSVLTQHAIPTPVLTSQPIVEYCCRIPTYRTIEGGRDRAIARMAFEVNLPASAVARHRKGDTTRFFAQVAERNNAFIRDALGDGELVKLGLFDTKRLDQKPTSAVLDFSQELVAEIWLRRIKAARSDFVA